MVYWRWTLVGKDHLSGRLVPLAIVADAGGHADGAENGVGTGGGVVGVLNQQLGSETEVPAAVGH